LCVYYQPIYFVPQRSLEGFEALVRWNHPGKGFLEPHDFIPLAEEMSIIRDIDYLVLNEAARQLKKWRKKFEHAKNIKMNINLSGIHFNNTAILAEIGHVLKDNKLSNDSLQIELTEGVIMDNTSRSAEIFQVLSQLGVHISIDDFGVGYSSLSRLTKLPVDMLKIDRGFVQSMIIDSSSLNITRAIIDLAHDLDMEVIAEGVETQGQFQILSRMGCHYAQGYYISKPLSLEDVEAFLANPPDL
jgi:EAL domain-containing protein (putative c-di-GMP-specific phosphodiesterase class I)